MGRNVLGTPRSPGVYRTLASDVCPRTTWATHGIGSSGGQSQFEDEFIRDPFFTPGRIRGRDFRRQRSRQP
jgi:hypothetical protein